MARDRRFNDVGAQDASRSGARPIRDARRSDLAGVPTCSRSSDDRGRLLYGGHGLAAPPLRALLHRVGQPLRAPRRLYAAPECNLGDPAGSPIRLDDTGAYGTLRFLIRDRDQNFTIAFDDVFRSNGLQILRTPIRAPQANGITERFVRTARAECLDWVRIANQRHVGANPRGICRALQPRFILPHLEFTATIAAAQ